MRKFLLCLLVFAAIGFAQPNSTVISTTIQPAKSIAGSTITFTSGVYTVPGGVWAKAAELSLTGTEGVLMVHLVKDPVNVYYPMPLRVGARNAALFNKVRQNGTTVDLSKVWIFVNE